MLIGLGWCTLHAQSVLDRHRDIRFEDPRPVFLPRGEVIKWLSMGYRGLVADALWISSVIYYGRRVVDEDNRYLAYARERGDDIAFGRHVPEAGGGITGAETGHLTQDVRARLQHLL